MTAWLWLVLGGLFEVGFTTSLRHVDGFRNLPWTLAFLACAGLSFTFLEWAMRTIPVGTAYTVWVGIGALGTILVGVIAYGESATPVRLLLMLALIACIVGLKLTAAK